jgi:oligopeptide transport system permease protein
MAKYIFQRILAAILTLFVILTIAFCVVRLMPGSVFDDPDLSDSVKKVLEERAHLDKPIFVQYLYFLKGVVTENDWGTSVKLSPGMPAFQVIVQKIPVTMALNFISLLIAVPFGALFGILAAMKNKTKVDTAISVGVILGISIPSFVFATCLQYFLAYKFGWFPILYQPTATTAVKVSSMVLPIFALALSPIATITRYLRGELIEVLNSDFMVLAKTKGLNQFQATVRHALRNAAMPLVSIILHMFAGVVGGSLVIERMFSIPGVGGLMIKSINALDHSLTVAVLIFYAMISVATALIVDLTYGVVDPRVRMGGKKDE